VDHRDATESFGNRSIRGAEHYDAFVAPFIAPITRRTIDTLQPPMDRLLDHGAGTGAVATAVLARWPAVRVTAIDPNAEMLARIRDDRVDARHGTLGDAGELGQFDAIVSQLAIAFVPDEHREM
jgi:trans-aconitate methyltransferase